MLRNYFKFLLQLILAVGVCGANAGAYEDFFRAVGVDDARTVGILLERGFDPNALDENGQNGLFLALRGNSPKVVAALLSHPGLKVDVANPANETPLMMAALRGEVDTARKLIERGGQVNRKGWTPLHYAATGPSVDAVQLLLERGAELEALSPNGTTPLMMAARYGTEASTDVLLKRGADTTRKNDKGLNAADFARLDGRDKLAARLQAITR